HGAGQTRGCPFEPRGEVDMKVLRSVTLTLIAALLVAAPAMARSSEGATRPAAAAPSVVQSYTGCLNPTVNLIYDVAPGETPAHPPCKLGSSDIHLSSGDLT